MLKRLLALIRGNGECTAADYVDRQLKWQSLGDKINRHLAGVDKLTQRP